MNSSRARNFVYVIIFVAIAGILLLTLQGQGTSNELALSALAQSIERGEVDRLQVNEGNTVEVTFLDGTTAVARKEGQSSLIEQLAALGVSEGALAEVEVAVRPPSQWNNLLPLISLLLPILFVVLIIYFMMRQVQGGNNQAMNFGKSRARMVTSDHPTVTFDDVAGCDEAKEELAEVVEFLKEPEKFISLGARIPKGVLLVGSPGTGKTLLAKAVSGEAGVPFFSISGSEFVEMFVGVGASRVRDLFDQAKRHSPCIIFIDEIDAVGRHRGAGLGGSHDEREQTLNQILVEMDGFDTDTNIIIVAATNRPDILDPALLRPGRFDRRIVVDRPDVKGREEIMKVHTRGKPLDPDVDVKMLAKATPGFVGADIENMVNEAAIYAARQGKKSISSADLQNAVERVQLGPERKSRVMTDRERKIVAYHEAGHAVIARSLMGNDELPVRKVTIVARGMAGGVTWLLPDESEERLRSREYIKGSMVVALGGRLAEEIALGEITSGASGDLQNVTAMARTMVMRWGMSDKLPKMAFGRQEQMVFLGKDLGEQRDYSEATAEVIDQEVSALVDEAYVRARAILTEHRDRLEAVAQALIEVETLDRDQLELVWHGKPLNIPVEEQKSKAMAEKPEAAKPETGSSEAPATGKIAGAPA